MRVFARVYWTAGFLASSQVLKHVMHPRPAVVHTNLLFEPGTGLLDCLGMVLPEFLLELLFALLAELGLAARKGVVKQARRSMLPVHPPELFRGEQPQANDSAGLCLGGALPAFKHPQKPDEGTQKSPGLVAFQAKQLLFAFFDGSSVVQTSLVIHTQQTTNPVLFIWNWY